MSIRPITASAHALALIIPLLFAILFHQLPPLLPFVPIIVGILLAGLFAKLAGLAPAIVFIASSSVAAWRVVSGFLSSEPVSVLLRVALYLAVATAIAGLSRRRSREAIEAEHRYRSLVEFAPDGVVVIDEQGRIVFANSALARLLGASDPAVLIGRHSVDFLHPEDREEARRRIGVLALGQRVPWIASRAVRLDGTLVHVERAGIPLERGDKMYAQGFVRDLTERDKAAAKIEESQRRLQALFDTSMDAMILIDGSGRYIDANPAVTLLTGYTREEILQMKVGDLAPIERRKDVAEVWDSFARGQVTTGGELQVLRKDGGIRDVEYRLVPNIATGLHYSQMHDITDRKEAERSLRELSGKLLRMQDDERRRIARELHDTTAQNLAAIRVNLSRISKSDGPMSGLVEESLRLTDQSISEVRTLSYLLHPPLIDEAGLVPSLRWFTRGFQDRSGITVTLDAPEGLQRLQPDVETALFRIVQEALSNIQRHSGSTVAHIRLGKEPHDIRLEIEDQGRGLPEDLREQSALVAAGVGIAAIQQRARELGGAFRIESRECGTRIVVTLPIDRK